MTPIELIPNAKKPGLLTWKHGSSNHGLLKIFSGEGTGNPLFVLDLTGTAVPKGWVPDRRFPASEVAEFHPDE